MVKRDWFNKHAYNCLPLTIGNQYGWGIRSLQTFEATWNGGPKPNDVTVTIIESDDSNFQQVSAHFGMGLVTVQNLVMFHTPKFVNMLIGNPPNIMIDGLQNMTAVVETDNLLRDFTFNLRLTRRDYTVRVNKGDIISGMMPVPRYFVDSFDVKLGKDAMSRFYYQHIYEMNQEFARERIEDDQSKKNGNGRRYFNGEDAFGCPFHDHQRKINKPEEG